MVIFHDSLSCSLCLVRLRNVFQVMRCLPLSRLAPWVTSLATCSFVSHETVLPCSVEVTCHLQLVCFSQVWVDQGLGSHTVLQDRPWSALGSLEPEKLHYTIANMNSESRELEIVPMSCCLSPDERNSISWNLNSIITILLPYIFLFLEKMHIT